MELISKQDMIKREWNTFEHYPKQGMDIVLHIKGYHIRNNKYSHDFIRILKFDGTSFTSIKYIPKTQSIIWRYSWLPVSKLWNKV